VIRSFFVQGHSAWGQFELIGRVRPGDGFVTVSKEYVSWSRFYASQHAPLLLRAELKKNCYGYFVQTDGDRGRWLYRGYFVGDDHGNFTGRWRDTLSPAEVLGYEGCFFMGRRRECSVPKPKLVGGKIATGDLDVLPNRRISGDSELWRRCPD
jgi:hypothetical protein